MSKKKGPGRARPVKPIPPGLHDGLREVESAIAHRRWDVAVQLVLDLTARFGRRIELLRLAVPVFTAVEAHGELANTTAQLALLEPENPTWTFGLIKANSAADRPASAIHQMRRFLELWPDHGAAPEVLQLLAKSEAAFLPIWISVGAPASNAVEVIAFHEAAQVLMQAGQYKAAQETSGRALRLAPRFVPGWHLQSMCYHLDSRFSHAVECSNRALQIDGEDILAQADLAINYWMLGDKHQVEEFAALLRNAKPATLEAVLRVAEAFALLGDDAAIIKLWSEVRPQLDWPDSAYFPYLLHTAAVAHARVGNVDIATQLWEEALKLNPSASLAEENLYELDEDPLERHLSWYYRIPRWMGRKASLELTAIIEKMRRPNELATRQAFLRWVNAQPNIEMLTEALLDRSEPMGSDFAWRWTSATRLPKLLEIARDFALGKSGNDALRHEIALDVFDAGLLPDSIRFWWDGDWRDLKLAKFDLYFEADEGYDQPVQSLLQAGFDAAAEGRYPEAEIHYRAALDLQPGAASVKNNLAQLVMRLGRKSEGEILFQEIMEENPAYPFARINLARLAIDDGRVREARDFLEPLADKRRFHHSEFAGWVKAHIDLATSLKQPWQAYTWIAYLRKELPKDPDIRGFEMRMILDSL